ncbi:hypothetical protein [Photobacterium sanguinicancri]|uniref:hypothetical protein n=1 Tax=Photobacterium sanguinicancri TaxID=875932 RepID=UPI0021C42C3C|nr:hypothetical protein [Photobacterium sanguinicancri]
MNNKLKLLGIVLIPMMLTACNGGGSSNNGHRSGGEDGCPRGMERERGVCVPDDDNGHRSKPNPGFPGSNGEISTAGFYNMIRDSENVATIDSRGNVLFWDDYYEGDRKVEATANVRASVKIDQDYFEQRSCRKGDSSYGYVRPHEYRFSQQSGSVQFATNCGEDNGGIYQQQAHRKQTMGQQMILTSIDGIVIEVTDNQIMDEQGNIAMLEQNNHLTTQAGTEDCEQEYIITDNALAILPSDLCKTPTFTPGIYKNQ